MTVSRKLGKLAPKRSATVNAADFFVPPIHPPRDPAPAVASWPMDRNDEAGVCVVSALNHTLQAQATLLGTKRQNWTDDQILTFYRTQNPGFRSWADAGGPNDGGMVIQTFLEHLVATGEIVAFGAVPLSEDMLKAGIWVGLSIVTGEMLDVAQQRQDVWDYVPGSLTWGGHATCSVAYDPDHQGVVTWGELVEVTDAFVTEQVDEAWLILTRELIADPGFRNSFDLGGFADAIANLTSGKVVVPTDVPVDPYGDFPFYELDQWAQGWHLSDRSCRAARKYRAWRARHP